MQPFRNSAQCMSSTIWKKGNLFVCCNIEWLCLNFQTIDIIFSFQAGWSSRPRPDKSELFLRITTQFGDLKELANVVLKYSPSSDYTIRITHMEGEEIFGSYKWKVNLAPGSKGDSHRHNYVNFSHPCVNHTIVSSSVNTRRKLCIFD
jgi:hypothetical protein